MSVRVAPLLLVERVLDWALYARAGTGWRVLAVGLRPMSVTKW